MCNRLSHDASTRTKGDSTDRSTRTEMTMTFRLSRRIADLALCGGLAFAPLAFAADAQEQRLALANAHAAHSSAQLSQAARHAVQRDASDAVVAKKAVRARAVTPA